MSSTLNQTIKQKGPHNYKKMELMIITV